MIFKKSQLRKFNVFSGGSARDHEIRISSNETGTNNYIYKSLLSEGYAALNLSAFHKIGDDEIKIRMKRFRLKLSFKKKMNWENFYMTIHYPHLVSQKIKKGRLEYFYIFDPIYLYCGGLDSENGEFKLCLILKLLGNSIYLFCLSSQFM